jgi:lipoprotein signal peptidase
MGPPLRTGIFNVADVAVTGGFALFVLSWRLEQ